jgi:hypothetical protein
LGKAGLFLANSDGCRFTPVITNLPEANFSLSISAEASAEILKENYTSGKLVMTGVNRHPSDLARKSPAFPKPSESKTDFPSIKNLFLDA